MAYDRKNDDAVFNLMQSGVSVEEIAETFNVLPGKMFQICGRIHFERNSDYGKTQKEKIKNSGGSSVGDKRLEYARIMKNGIVLNTSKLKTTAKINPVVGEAYRIEPIDNGFQLIRDSSYDKK